MQSTVVFLYSMVQGDLSSKMQHWQDSEIMELFLIWGEKEIKQHDARTVRDTMIYTNVSKMLSERGIDKNPRQVLNKLKALKKKYLAINDKTNHGRMGHAM